jgi:ABC-2 type transport system permease protein
MRQANVFAKSLVDQRWQVLGFALALFSMAALVVYIWPSYKDSLAELDLPPAIEAIFGRELSYATAPGFVSVEFFSWIPILLIVYATIQGTGAVAGEESAGTIDLLLAQPLSRTRLVLEKCAAALVGAALIIAGAMLGFIASVPFVDIEVSIPDTLVASANMLPITMAFYGFALWAGAVAPGRGAAAAWVTAVATLSYFAYSIANGVEDLSWLRYVTPFYYYGAGLPLVRGIDWPHVAVLLGSALIFIAGALRVVNVRDVTLGGAHGLSFARLARRAVGLPA